MGKKNKMNFVLLLSNITLMLKHYDYHHERTQNTYGFVRMVSEQFFKSVKQWCKKI